MRTYTARAEDVEREWYVIDAAGRTLGRLATEVATVLRGKHKPIFTPHVDCGDHVIVVNARDVEVSGMKATEKLYHRHSGFPGSVKSVPFLSMVQQSPEKVVEQAVRGMVPKNRLGRRIMKKLRVYPGSDHPHAAQQPAPFPDLP